MGMKRLLWGVPLVILLLVGLATDSMRMDGWLGRWFEGTAAVAGPTKADLRIKALFALPSGEGRAC